MNTLEITISIFKALNFDLFKNDVRGREKKLVEAINDYLEHTQRFWIEQEKVDSENELGEMGGSVLVWYSRALVQMGCRIDKTFGFDFKNATVFENGFFEPQCFPEDEDKRRIIRKEINEKKAVLLNGWEPEVS